MLDVLGIVLIIIGIVIVLIGRDKNEFIFGGIITVYYFIMVGSDLIEELEVFPIIFLLAAVYIISTVAFKLANKIESESKIVYIIAWSFLFSLFYFLFTGLLSSALY